ncbi:MAG: DUF692 family multinuclear iron-containing protein [Planctomycetota bacterium]
MQQFSKDNFGIGWRPEIAPGIFIYREHIDFVEVIAEDWYHYKTASKSALATLAANIPVTLHGVSMGLASGERIQQKRIDNIARLYDSIRPLFWSEHLCFTRAGEFEIGHLAAPPRTQQNIGGFIDNIEAVRRTLGADPLLENIATLIEPPGSEMTEGDWTARSLDAANCNLLLDLHNLYANALNRGADPFCSLREMPVERVRAVHLAGGRWIGAGGNQQKLLDDHLHSVPDICYELLEELGALAPQPLFVSIERDGRFPPFLQLLGEIDRARQSLAHGRDRAGAACTPSSLKI